MRHLPFPSACISQALSLIFLPLAILPFALNLCWPIIALPLGIISFIWLCDLSVFILSLTVWWNVSLQISQDGIAKKGNQINHWSDATVFSIKKGLPTVRGPLFCSVIIYYANGVVIAFEPSEPLIKDISLNCSDKVFIEKLNHSVKSIYEKRR